MGDHEGTRRRMRQGDPDSKETKDHKEGLDKGKVMVVKSALSGLASYRKSRAKGSHLSHYMHYCRKGVLIGHR